MIRWLILLFIAVPILELWLLLRLADWTSGLTTFLVVLGTGMAGVWLAKLQGLSIWLRLQDQLRRGEMPTDTVLDGLMILVAAAFLVTPGLITDCVGLALLLPPVRRGVRAVLARWSRLQVHSYGNPTRSHDMHGEVIDSYVVQRDSDDDPTPPPAKPRQQMP